MATAVMPVVAEEVALEEEEDLLAETLAERWGEMGDSYWEAKAAEWDNHKFGLCGSCADERRKRVAVQRMLRGGEIDSPAASLCHVTNGAVGQGAHGGQSPL